MNLVSLGSLVAHTVYRMALTYSKLIAFTCKSADPRLDSLHSTIQHHGYSGTQGKPSGSNRSLLILPQDASSIPSSQGAKLFSQRQVWLPMPSPQHSLLQVARQMFVPNTCGMTKTATHNQQLHWAATSAAPPNLHVSTILYPPSPP